MLRRAEWISVLFGASVLACAAHKPSPPTRPAQSAPVIEAPEPVAWYYRPKAPNPSLASLPLGSATLHVTGRGERWLVDEHRRLRSNVMAGEALVDLARLGSDFAFVGASGTIYLSAEALGAFGEVRSPTIAITRAALSGDALTAVGADGTLLRGSALSGALAPLPLDGPFIDLAFAGSHGVALALPESVWISRDSGATWERMDAHPFGAQRILRGAGDQLVIEGALGTRTVDPGRSTLVDRATSTSSGALELGDVANPEPAALTDGTAAVDGDRYWDVVQRDQTWHIRSGTLASSLVSVPLASLVQTSANQDSRLNHECRALKIGAFGDSVHIACEVGTQVIVLRSRDRGKHFERWHTVPVTVNPSMPRPAPSPLKPTSPWRLRLPPAVIVPTGITRENQRSTLPDDGIRIVSGATGMAVLIERCSEPSPSCPRNSLSILNQGSSPKPWLFGSPELIAGATFSVDGHTAYALTCDPWKNALLLRKASLDTGALTHSSVDASRFLTRWQTPDRVCDVAQRVVALTPTADARIVVTLGGGVPANVVLSEGSDRTHARIDRWIELFGLAQHAFAGLRGLRLVSRSWFPDSRLLEETNDGGDHWHYVDTIVEPLCRGGCALACASKGCWVGSELARSGWGTGGSLPQSQPPPKPISLGKVPASGPRLVLHCTAPGNRWIDVEAAPSSRGLAARGHAWMAIAHNADGSVDAVRGVARPKQRTERHRLLDRGTRALTHASELGVAAMRRRALSDGQLELELAWLHADRDVVVRQRVTVPELARGFVAPPRERAKLFDIRLVPQGVYAAWDSPVVFADGRRFELPGGNSGSMPIADFVFVGGRHLAVRLAPDVTRIGVERNGAWKFDAGITTGQAYPSHLFVHTTLGYTAKSPGLIASFVRPHPRAFFIPISSSGELGAPAKLPELESRPIACKPRQRSSTPRRWLRGVVNARILIRDSVELRVYGSALVQGDGAEACVSFFEARSASGQDGSFYAIVDPADPEHGWLFESSGSGSDRPRTPLVHWRPIRCRLE